MTNKLCSEKIDQMNELINLSITHRKLELKVLLSRETGIRHFYCGKVHFSFTHGKEQFLLSRNYTDL